MKRARRVDHSKFDKLQHKTEQIRNICILAHVDHGKSSIADCLLSSNGILSPRLVASLRYLDSRDDEQDRGITMESSAISLLFRHQNLNLKALRDTSSRINEPNPPSSVLTDYLINLIDSPGHVDFSSDVSSAIRLCDGALVVVDSVEGVGVQTHEVIKKALEEKLDLILVLNKIDRLIIELHYDAVEAYEHLLRIVEQTNAVISTFLTKDSEDSPELEYFKPEQGNVVFTSALYNFGFRVIDFVPFAYKKLVELGVENLKPVSVLKGLWGPFALNPKNKTLYQMDKITASEAKRTNVSGSNLFASFIFQTVIEVFDAAIPKGKPKKALRIASGLDLSGEIPEKVLKIGGKDLIMHILSQKFPLTTAVLSSVVLECRDPGSAQEAKIDVLWPGDVTMAKNKTRQAIARCQNDQDAPLVAFVSKVVSLEKDKLGAKVVEKLSSLQDNVASLPDELFFVFARIFSGQITSGKKLTTLGPKYHIEDHQEIRQKHILDTDKPVLPFRPMGPDLHPLEVACAGTTVVLYGVAENIMKVATLVDANALSGATSLSPLAQKNAALLRVAIHPEDPLNWEKLVEGLKLLNRADSVVEVKVENNGQYVLGCIGELHLERCLKDLQERYAKVPVKVSEPILSLRETLVPTKGKVEPTVVKFLINEDENLFFMVKVLVLRLPEGANDKIHLDSLAAGETVDHELTSLSYYDSNSCLVGESVKALPQNLLSSLKSGFEVFCRSGPLCDEAVTKCSVVIFDATITDRNGSPLSSGMDHFLHVSPGILMSNVIERYREAFLTNKEERARVEERMYQCDFICHIDLQKGDQLGSLYKVISQKRGQVISEELIEGSSNIFSVKAYIPVAESFGLATQLRKMTSGTASTPQLVFSHWEMIDLPPFFKPRTEEEVEEFGEEGMDHELSLKGNVAYRYIHTLRKQKGLKTEEKIVNFGEKQRTLSRKK
eukprot:maker-scaffold_13-snap-gene-5.0-mRNA-1 protein AED:0.02 eAED:0.02 QI:0/0/0/0.5/1/1/2/0/948